MDGCKHNAYIETPHGRKCLLCGEIVTAKQEAGAEPAESAAKAGQSAKPGKSAPAKRQGRTNK